MNSRFWYAQPYGERYKRAEGPPYADSSAWWEPLQQAARMPENWSPPKYTLVGGKQWPDWMMSWVPLWSARTVQTLHPWIADSCQLIPWVNEPGHAYSLVNLLTVIPRDEWTCEDSSIYGREYASANVIRISSLTIPPLFRLEKYSGKTFVSDEFAKRSVSAGLRGVAFIHPLIHETESFFLPRPFGRHGTGFVTRQTDPDGNALH
jgi:hypothetical protein